jgi:hypothetical protein
VDAAAAAAIAVVALAVVLAAAAWRHRRGGIHVEVWWDDHDRGDEDDEGR